MVLADGDIVGLTAMGIAVITTIAIIWQLKKTEDAKYMDILKNTISDLHAIYDKEESLVTKNDCEMYAVRLLDTMSSLAHLQLQRKIDYQVLNFLKYDFSVTKCVMEWFDKHNLDEKYGSDTGVIWSNLTKYYKKHPEIEVADQEVLPNALRNFGDLETTVFVYGTLVDNLTRTAVIGRQVWSKSAVLKGYEISKTLTIENKTYPVVSPTKSGIVNGMVINLTPVEIISLDEWETDAYKRILVTLENDEQAWLYVENDGN